MYQASAMAIGTLITLMLFANGSLQTAFGASRSLVIIHATGTLAVLVYLMARRASFKTTEKIKPYLYLSGVMGVLLVFFNITTVSSIGLTLTIALGLVGQIIASSVVDHYGLFALEKRRWNMKKLSGFALIAAGIAVMAWPKA